MARRETLRADGSSGRVFGQTVNGHETSSREFRRCQIVSRKKRPQPDQKEVSNSWSE
jgi:hypothetical protein